LPEINLAESGKIWQNLEIKHSNFDQLPRPEVNISGLDMKRIKQAFSNVDRKINQKELTLRQQKILNFLHNKEPLSAKKIHKGLKEQISERSLRNDLLELKAQGLLKMMGNGPSTLWVNIE
jgi:predicted HTH transcriptional regulator